MPSSYSTNLKIELQATGENSGTWGTITNTNLGTALEQAIIGYGNPNYLSDANLTLTYTDTNSAQTARALVLNVTSALSLTGTRELVIPTIQKQYIVQNNTTGGQSITVKTSAGTGITVPNGRKAHLYVNGTDVIYMDDYVDINGGAIDGTPVGANSASTGAFSTLSATGNVNFDGGTFTFNDSGADKDFRVEGDTDANLLFSDASTDRIGIGTNTPASKLDVNGTITATAVNTTTLDLTNLEVTNIKAKDGTSAASIADSTGVVSFTANPILSGGTANGVLYLNGSKVATSGAAFGFDGTNLTLPAEGYRPSATSFLRLSGGDGAGSGANLLVFGQSHATAPGRAVLTATGTGYLELNTNGGSARLDSSGNVGIGTSSPSNKLNVSGNGYLFALNGGLTNRVAQTFGNTGGGLDLGIEGSAGGTVFTGGSSYAGVIGTNNATALQLGTNGTIRATLDSSGNLGLGVTPSAWGSGLKALQVGANSYASLFDFDNGVTSLSSNLFWNGSAYSRISASSRWSFAYFQDTTNGAHSWVTSTAAGTSTPTMSTLMTLNASGNLGIGTTTIGSRVTIGDPGTGLAFSNAASGNFNIGLLAGTGSALAYVYQRANSDLIFGTNNTERARIPAAGGFQCVNSISVGNATPTTSGAGITFPATQSASSNANTLDDYEEGSFDPTFTAVGITGVTYSARTGRYTKIGRIVFIEVEINLSNKGTGGVGALLVGNLPFTVASGSYNINFGGLMDKLASDLRQVSFQLIPGQTNIYTIKLGGSTGAHDAMILADFTNTSVLRFGAHYIID